MTAEVEAKLNSYVMAVDTEIAGMGKVRVSDEGDIMLLDVAIYDQTVTGGTADLSSEALARFQMELIQKGESPKDWTLWWHSHADMPAFFSGTDTGTIDASTEYQYLVSLVVNRRRERKARLDLYHPFRFTQDNLAIIVGTTQEVIPEAIRAEVAEKVHVKTWSWEKGNKEHRVGFGQHHGEHLDGNYKPWEMGKVSPASSDDDYASRLSGRERSVGEIIEVVPEELDRYEIHVIIDNLKEKLKDFILAGKSTDPEAEELRDEIDDWQIELQTRDDAQATADAIRDYHERN